MEHGTPAASIFHGCVCEVCEVARFNRVSDYCHERAIPLWFEWRGERAETAVRPTLKAEPIREAVVPTPVDQRRAELSAQFLAEMRARREAVQA